MFQISNALTAEGVRIVAVKSHSRRDIEIAETKKDLGYLKEKVQRLEREADRKRDFWTHVKLLLLGGIIGLLTSLLILLVKNS